jgi:hypothetical protein
MIALADAFAAQRAFVKFHKVLIPSELMHTVRAGGSASLTSDTFLFVMKQLSIFR